MSTNYLPANDTEYAVWLGNFNTVAANQSDTLGLTTAQIGSLAQSLAAMNTAITNDTAARAASKAATQAKHTTHRASTALVREIVRQIQANPAVTNALKQSLGITVKAAPAHTPPVTPSSLTVQGQSNGVNVLTWNGGGNKPGTVYCIESRPGSGGTWTMLDVTTRVKYLNDGVTPGVGTKYRVRAKRGSLQSAFSNEAVVYGS